MAGEVDDGECAVGLADVGEDDFFGAQRENRRDEASRRVAKDGRRCAGWRGAGERGIERLRGKRLIWNRLNEERQLDGVFAVLGQFAVGGLESFELLFGFETLLGIVLEAVGMPELGGGAECLVEDGF